MSTSSNPLTRHPHVYKKGKILNLKRLDEGYKTSRTYLFSSSNASIVKINDHCNNINQILGRTYLGMSKLLSYLGLSRDPSEKHSKTPSVYNKFFPDFLERGNYKVEKPKDLEPLMNKILSRLDSLEPKITSVISKTDKLEKDLERLHPKDEEKAINRNEVLDFTNRLKEIQQKLNDILGA